MDYLVNKSFTISLTFLITCLLEKTNYQINMRHSRDKNILILYRLGVFFILLHVKYFQIMTDLIHRAWAEFNKLKGLGLSCSSRVKFLIDSSPFDEDGEVAAASKFCFIGRLLPNSSPLNQTALKIEITLPEKYPVQPPIVRVLTPMHHPNVLKEG